MLAMLDAADGCLHAIFSDFEAVDKWLATEPTSDGNVLFRHDYDIGYTYKYNTTGVQYIFELMDIALNTVDSCDTFYVGE